MVNPDFSEFQFAYGITRELDAGQGPFRTFGTPFFLTQHQERHLGYDLGWRIIEERKVWSLFLQFKRSKKLTDSRAKTEQWETYQDDFFRFKVRTTDDSSDPKQHERLYFLGQLCPHTYYVAPEFVEWDEYVKLARSNQINSNSAFLQCSTAPTPIDNQSHYICHRPKDSFGLFFSQAPEDQMVRLLRGFEQLRTVMKETGPTAESYEGLRGELSETRSAIVDDFDLDVSPQEYTAEEPLAWIGQQQRFFYENLGILLSFVTMLEE